jgi:hypothetical protein
MTPETNKALRLAFCIFCFSYMAYLLDIMVAHQDYFLLIIVSTNVNKSKAKQCCSFNNIYHLQGDQK